MSTLKFYLSLNYQPENSPDNDRSQTNIESKWTILDLER